VISLSKLANAGHHVEIDGENMIIKADNDFSEEDAAQWRTRIDSRRLAVATHLENATELHAGDDNR
jgi:hypothetical protein